MLTEQDIVNFLQDGLLKPGPSYAGLTQPETAREYLRRCAEAGICAGCYDPLTDETAQRTVEFADEELAKLQKRLARKRRELDDIEEEEEPETFAQVELEIHQIREQIRDHNRVKREAQQILEMRSEEMRQRIEATLAMASDCDCDYATKRRVLAMWDVVAYAHRKGEHPERLDIRVPKADCGQ